MTNNVLIAIRLLSTPGQIIEVRAIAEDGVASGYFDSPEGLVANVDPLDGLPTVQGIYVTLNPVNPALFSRRANRIKMRLGKKDATTADSDIVRRQWLPVDIDPVRPSGVSSTEAEHATALAKARSVAEFLTGKGFPSPVFADSGNGAHLLYRIDIPNDEAGKALVKRCLDVLAAIFDDEHATIDTANYNAARIWKLYGTMSRKGDNTADRPHRRSAIISAPAVPAIVSKEVMEQLAKALPDDPAPTIRNGQAEKVFDLRHWLADHKIGVQTEKPWQGGTIYILHECPFSGNHKDGAFAIQFPGGGIHAGCHHQSCGGGSQRWQELRKRYETVVERYKQQEQPGNTCRHENTGSAPPRLPPGPSPSPGMVDMPCRAEALEVLQHGNPVAFMLSAFAQEHVGDEILARCMILSMASQAVKNSDGLHVSVTGESGKGKTHAFKKMMRQVPDRYKVKGSVSNKALFYKKDLAPRTTFMSDDIELSDSIQEILKSATSNFDEPITHNTVTKDLISRVCTIPERCVWWIGKKEGTGDNQVANRMLTCWIDESPKQDTRVLLAKQKKEQLDPDTIVDESPELVTSRAIWELLHEQLIWVIIPYSDRIRFHSIANRRNPDMLYDLIKSQAVLSFMQRRTKTTKDGTLCIYADEADFEAANEVFSKLNETAGGQESKMTKKESDLLLIIGKADRDEFTIQDLQQFTGGSYMGFYRMIKGYDSRGKNYTGLLEKCPALSFTDRMVTITEDDGRIVRRRTEAYTWDRDLYRQWTIGGACWLDRDPDNGNDDGAGNLQHLQHVYSSFTATAVNDNGAPCVPGSQKEDDSKNNLVLRDGQLQQNENYGGIQNARAGADACVHEMQSAVNEDRFLSGAPQNDNPAPKQHPLVYSNCCKPAESVLKTHTGAVNNHPHSHPPQIHATEYKPLDIPEPHVHCHCCGKKGSWYVEKLTAERKARPKDERAARRVCRMCYDAAVHRDRASAPPLPGMINLLGMERHFPNIGKCSVCNLGSATYLNKETGVKLCEACHTREVQRQCSRAGVTA